MKMDAEASTGAVNNIELYYLKFSDGEFPTHYKQRGSVIKYTKIPDYDFESRATWGRSNYTLPPRLRRIISLDDPLVHTTRSVKTDIAEHRPSTARNQRKIVPITEVEEAEMTGPKNARATDRAPSSRSSRPKLQSHRAIQVSVFRDSGVGNTVQKSPSRNSSRYHSESSAKLIKTNKSDVNISRVNSKMKYSPSRQPLNFDNVKSRYLGDAKESPRRSKTSTYSKTSLSNKIVRQNSGDKIQVKLKSSEPQNQIVTVKRLPETRPLTTHPSISTPSVEEHDDTHSRASVIHVPLDQKQAKKAPPPKSLPRRRLIVSQPTHTQPPHTALDISSRYTVHSPVSGNFKSRCSETEDSIIDEDVDLATDRKLPNSCVSVRKEHSERREIFSSVSERKETIDVRGVTRWNDAIIVPIEPQYADQAIDATPAATLTVERSTSTTNTDITERLDYTEKTVGVTMFDDLQIPDLTLSKSEPTHCHETLSLPSLALPDLKIPPVKITASAGHGRPKGEVHSEIADSTSYIIGTLMYTTKQKINIQLVSDKSSSKTLGPVSSFPLSVVSVFKKDMKSYNDDTSATTRSSQISNKCSLTLDNSLLNCNNSSRLRKPSDIISSLTVNKSLLKTDLISGQFERELNFIDSFFESLQYLESCSSQGQQVTPGQEKWLQSLEMDHSEYNNFLSKLEDGATKDESDTIMSRSLCLLNLLIRDEQRRAKDLLFVLKMREDALKDYTKSQIIWLENKKKQDNTDISQLKKKQRGALLKLQYECGEMQRMRKALLALSEKRKTALMKTKKNIELKLTSDVDVERILSKKKQLRRSTSSERTIPLKCFELSSSADDMLRAPKTEEKDDSQVDSANGSVEVVASFERETTPTQTSEKCVAVDGRYLNIVFNDLAMPQIFHSGKQYEVNEEALHNILNAKHAQQKVECIDQFVEQVQKVEDKSTSPSTARSLVEEFNQYYKDFAVGEKDSTTSPEEIMLSDSTNTDTVFVVKPQRALTISASVSATDFAELSMETLDEPVDMASVETTTRIEKLDKDVEVEETQTGPLPLPAGDEASDPEAVVQTDPHDWPRSDTAFSISEESSEESLRPSSQPSYSERSSLTALAPLASPVDCEAERLRLQQIAIEREIKALERQQQCQMLVVRSIPDKPPPPYCAPADAGRRAFAPDAVTEPLICQHMTGTAPPAEDAFAAFVADYCAERAPDSTDSGSDKPWDARNQLPQSAAPAFTTIVRGACEDLRSVLGTVPPTQVSGLASRRSDHIDDILFAEWRRCEPEWAALHVDEAIVKNQLFESIFQKVLTDTIDEYKVKVLGPEQEEG